MQANRVSLKGIEFFLFCLLAVGLVVLISNIAGEETANLTTDLTYIPASGGLLALSVIIAIRFRGIGDHGKAYIFFTVFVSFWAAAECLWLRSEMSSHLSPFPEEIDWLYLAGYPFLFCFSVYYLKPLRLLISKKMFTCASIAAAVFLIPTIHTMYSFNPNATVSEIAWAAIYPISDVMVLFPAVLGMMLFFNGKAGLFWSLAFIAIILNIVADSGFFFLDIDRSYSGNPINILYLWSYILFAFGIYSHIKLYGKPKMKFHNNTWDLR